MTTFTAVTVLDGSVETPIIQEFEYMGQTWVVHNSIKVYTDHFRVSHKEGSDRFPPAWFLSMLTGPDNESDYSYVGMLDAGIQ